MVSGVRQDSLFLDFIAGQYAFTFFPTETFADE